MRYRPPGLAAGLIVMLAAVVVVGLLIHRSPRPWVEADTGERGLA
jgi:hypothetical protein